MRLLLALAFIINMHIHQLDVSNAFCYAHVDGDVYMQPVYHVHMLTVMCIYMQPVYHVIIALSWKNLCTSYGAPCSWLKFLEKYIKSLHFTPCLLKPCLYHTTYKGVRMYLTIHVVDIIIACDNLAYIYMCSM